ncbi:MAG: DNA repair protein RadA [Elusimicrobia bacterium]|nr:DNA repair protein RadA [Elusimicrobiota bacterium]
MFVCKECGYKSQQRLGQCPYCGKWGTFIEEKISSRAAESRESVKISSLKPEEFFRIHSRIAEFDQLLGGGIVKGSVILIAGNPGIGKSTLLLQLVPEREKVLYVTGEESPSQVAQRARRIKAGEHFYLLSSRKLENAENEIERISPSIVIIDSVQSVVADASGGFSVSPAALRAVTSRITELAKTKNISFILSGHVTKEGVLQGPKIIEHIVDVVLYFEESPSKKHRILYSTKNRFGNTQEFVLFTISAAGLNVVDDPSKFFLSSFANVPGSVAVSAFQGSSPFIGEIQSLINRTSFQFPRRQVIGLDLNRVYLASAIIERIFGFKLYLFDIYLNVAGGIRITEPAADLAIAFSILSSYKKAPIDRRCAFAAEIGLGGELRGVSDLAGRVRKAEKLGFEKFFTATAGEKVKSKMKIFYCRNLKDCFDAVW